MTSRSSRSITSVGESRLLTDTIVPERTRQATTRRFVKRGDRRLEKLDQRHGIGPTDVLSGLYDGWSALTSAFLPPPWLPTVDQLGRMGRSPIHFI